MDGEKISVFVGNIPWDATEATLKEFCEQYEISPMGCRVVYDSQNGKSRGFGYCDFTTQEEANKLLDLHGIKMNGRDIRCDMSNGPAGGGSRGGGRGGSRGRGSGTGGSGGSGGFGRGGGGGGFGRGGRQQKSREQQQADNETPSKLLMVRNLSFDTVNSTLESAFPDAIDARVVLERDPQRERETRKSRGFAFVEFEDIETATEAREKMNGTMLDGRELMIVFATPKPQGEGFRGRGRGRGGFQ